MVLEAGALTKQLAPNLDPGLSSATRMQTHPLLGPGRKGGYRLPPVTKAQRVLARGPAYLTYARTAEYRSGPMQPPPGFVTPTTSAVEWNFYWACAKYFKDPQNPRQGPFFGPKLQWGYQIGLDGGRQEGGAVVDFLIYSPGRSRRLGVRIVTQYFHLGLGSGKIAFDEIQLSNLLKYIDVVDVYDSQLLDDKTGEKSMIALYHALSGMNAINPVAAGTALPNRSV